jgi:hypothetical protein
MRFTKVVAAGVVAVTAVLGAGHVVPATVAVTEDTPDAVVNVLQLTGWRGDPTDGQEALYSPAAQ